MARVEMWYRCPTCQSAYDKMGEAAKCKDSHPIKEEKWAVGKSGKSVRIFENCSLHSLHGLLGALKEADLSDDIEERKRQLKELKS